MGTPAPIYTPGVACPVCWGVNKPFGNTQPPLYASVTIVGVEKSSDWYAALGEPVNGTYTVTQNAFLPCFYSKSGGVADITCPMTSGLGLLRVKNEVGVTCFTAGVFPNCWTSVPNFGTFGFENGTLTIDFLAGAP